MKVYLFDESGIFLKADEADSDPLNDDEFLLPINGTEIAPPDIADGQRAVFKVEAWIVEEIPAVVVQQEPKSEPVPITAEYIRGQRDAALAASDWVVIKSQEGGLAAPDAWRTYRQALRDIPEQPGFPTEIEWPIVPGVE